MKRGTPRHPKMYALAEALKIPLPHAVGIMEMLWQFTASNVPRGDIGCLPDPAIAQAVGWTKKANALVDALCQCSWLDRNQEFRLIVHDWPEHAEYEVVRALTRSGKDFLSIYGVSVLDRGDPGAPKSGNSALSRGAKALASQEALGSNTKRARGKNLSFEEMVFRWNRHPGFKKPNKAVMAKAALYWQNVEMDETEADLALDGYFAAKWAKEQKYPPLGFFKNPHSWITNEPGEPDEPSEVVGDTPEPTEASERVSETNPEKYYSGEELAIEMAKAIARVGARKLAEAEADGSGAS